MMGGPPASVETILSYLPDLKVNIILGPENKDEVIDTLRELYRVGIRRVNLREPYGQQRIGNPLSKYSADMDTFGMPTYKAYGLLVTYWDVHYVEVSSLNLYADGTISNKYVVADDNRPQETFGVGRQVEQWV
jgi:hypothetical protein